jgi:hypothetical protein
VSSHVLPRVLDARDLDARLAHALNAMRALVRQTTCAAHGHDYLVHASGNRICLRCADCGHETPGWRIEPKARRRTNGHDALRPSGAEEELVRFT